MKYLFLILSLLGFITYQDTVSTHPAAPAAQTAANNAISPRGPAASTDLGPVTAFEDGLPIPRR